MSYNGSGTFQINSAGQPVVTGTTISSTAFNALTADLATGLSTALTKDGQTTPTANIPLGGYKITGLANATLSTDAMAYGQFTAFGVPGYTTTATAAGTTTLTVSSTQQQFFTGSTTQTVVLPVTSTLVLGQNFRIVNMSSGVVTVNSSGGNAVVAMVALSEVTVTCILTSGTTAASWDIQYTGHSAVTGTGSEVLATSPTITSPTLVTPTLGVATATTVNKVTFTAPATGSTLTIADGKVLTANASLIFAGTDSTTMTFPATSTTVAGLSIAETFTAQQRGAISVLTDGATITPDFSLGNNYSVTLGGNRTLANPTNLTAGATGSLFISQDGTGSRTLSWGSFWDFAGGTAPTLTTTASAVDRVDYVVRTTGSIHAVATLNLS